MKLKMVHAGLLRAYKMRIIKNKKGIMWREIALWGIFIALLIVLLIIIGLVRTKMISDIGSLFDFLRM